MIEMLAQANPATETNWLGWIAGVGVPVILFLLTHTAIRLRRGDDKFDQLAAVTIKLSTQNESIKESIDEVKEKVDAQNQKIQDGQLEGTGSFGKLKADMEREFVRKAELTELRNHTDGQHAEVMRAIASIKQGR